MLDQVTKRKIDTARDILVGKVPDPKAQVEQITTALIYKFMDDMDRQSEELGGKANFFANGFEKYAWRNVVDKRLSGQERLNLYVEAIARMSKNPHLPQLFRDIFKDAFLPYRDPETLSLFLKEIDWFNYDHSENLGNAFEYLLSVLGSQGSAGQFRTPRHIIDFIVEVVDPKKDETVLDPACGTAGFLISAYKHILKHNSSNYKPEKEAASDVIKEGDSAAETVIQEAKKYHGDLLSPDERTKLMQNIEGYDISPDMVKLSLVNLYLHGFSNPKIFEYDTLTSEKRWNDQFDVIMANPPFMSPSGGIRPHKRFSVQAKRSEVLFVDYILEHLNLKGRAGIIVPEGIIFKSETAYKKLRQMLIEDGLFAVASLPPGVFNPYAGVKTSILFFDNQLAKRTDDILFVKIENDGFDLGAQRRKIDKNDLPTALEIINKYKTVIANSSLSQREGRRDFSDVILSEAKDLAHLVPKQKIIESLDYNLTGERYKEIEITGNQKWPLVELGEVLEYEQPTKYIVKSVDYDDTYKTPVLTAGKTFILGYTNEKEGIFPANKLPVIIFDDFTTDIKFVDFPFKVKSSAMKILHPEREKVHPVFIYHLMRGIKFRHEEHKRYWISEYSKIKIPLPPIEVQKEIVEQIEVKQNAIDHAKEIIKNLERERRYFGHLPVRVRTQTGELRKIEGVEWVELGEVCTFEYGKPLKETDRKGGEYPVYGSNGIVGYHNNYIVKGPFIIVGRKGTAGAVVYSEKSGFPIDTTFYVQLKGQKVDLKFLYLIMQTLELGKINTQAGVPGLNRNDAYKTKIPLPLLEVQKQLVAEAEKEEEIIASNQKLIKLMEAKINNVISDLWSESNG